MNLLKFFKRDNVSLKLQIIRPILFLGVIYIHVYTDCNLYMTNSISSGITAILITVY